MKPVNPRGLTPVKAAVAAAGAAALIFCALALLGNALPTVFSHSIPSVVYWVLFALFLLALLATTTALGTWWAKHAGRRREPLVATSALWLMIVSFMGIIAAWGAEAPWSENLATAGFVSALAGLVICLGSLFVLSKRSPKE
ncbi:hypothetical protein ACFY5D_20755 [Paeniglutamicibacter sp. NPDC012692]|uniref:hypothetical protein n=1 Tax=Paeniglutamicibacter sp. NPDC012692 TaxID=3364388 RepID=UPI0036CB9559